MHFKFFLLAVLWLSSFSFGQISTELTSQIESLIQSENPRKFNGVIMITENGKSVYHKAHGFADFEKKIPLKLNDSFIIMSNSKLFTSVLVLQEVEKGKIDLNEKISQYLPELAQSWKDSITVHQLLNHTHGIDDVNKPLLFKPGTDFKYGNISNVLLGQILEKINGKSFEEIAGKLFKKLKLKDTFCYNVENGNKAVSSYRLKNNEPELVNEIIHGKMVPAAGIISNAHDLAVWSYKLHHGKILKKESYKLLTEASASSQHDVFGKEKMGYGYNIRIAEEKGVKYMGHTGLGDGFASLNLYFPEEDLSLIILENVMGESSDNWYFYEKAIKDLVVESLSEN